LASSQSELASPGMSNRRRRSEIKYARIEIWSFVGSNGVTGIGAAPASTFSTANFFDEDFLGLADVNRDFALPAFADAVGSALLFLATTKFPLSLLL